MPQIAVKVSEPIFAKLKRLAHQGSMTYADVIERALSVYEPDTSEPASHGTSEIHGDLQALIESALQPVMERLAMLESMGLVKHQHPSVLTAQISPQNAPESAVAALTVEAAPIDQPEPEVPEIASYGVTEPWPEPGTLEAVHPVISEIEESEAAPSPTRSTVHPVKGLIDELVAGGERSQTRIANALNNAGLRTQTGTRFERGNPQIKKALDAARGK